MVKFNFLISIIHTEWVSLNRKSDSSEKHKDFAFYLFGRNIYELGGGTCEHYQVK